MLGINDPPVTIKNIENAIIDRGWDEGWVMPEPPAVRTGKKVAVVGSGPAGLAAAAQLNKAGHTVTVFERADRIGGLLMYGIPNMKLDKRRSSSAASSCWSRRASSSSANADVGKQRRAAEAAAQEFDAMVLCTGATQPRDLPDRGPQPEGRPFRDGLPDREHQGAARRQHQNGKLRSRAAARTSIVIGGGDTGTDCVGTSMRHGCKSLMQIEILPRRRRARGRTTPGREWPKVLQLDYGQEEAAAKFGSDPRVYLTTVKRFVGDAAGTAARSSSRSG